MELKDLCGEHLFSSVELTCEDAEIYGNVQKINILLFTLDGITYKASEDPEDGYRSCLKDIAPTDKKPRYSFPGISVLCSMENRVDRDVLAVRDTANGKVILRVGTDYTDCYYPYCVFEYTPEGMACNEARPAEVCTEQHWVNAQNRPPEDDHWVLIWHRTFGYGIDRYTPDKGWWLTPVEDVTHWAKLIKPPKKESTLDIDVMESVSKKAAEHEGE